MISESTLTCEHYFFGNSEEFGQVSADSESAFSDKFLVALRK